MLRVDGMAATRALGLPDNHRENRGQWLALCGAAAGLTLCLVAARVVAAAAAARRADPLARFCCIGPALSAYITFYNGDLKSFVAGQHKYDAKYSGTRGNMQYHLRNDFSFLIKSL